MEYLKRISPAREYSYFPIIYLLRRKRKMEDCSVGRDKCLCLLPNKKPPALPVDVFLN